MTGSSACLLPRPRAGRSLRSTIRPTAAASTRATTGLSSNGCRSSSATASSSSSPGTSTPTSASRPATGSPTSFTAVEEPSSTRPSGPAPTRIQSDFSGGAYLGFLSVYASKELPARHRARPGRPRDRRRQPSSLTVRISPSLRMLCPGRIASPRGVPSGSSGGNPAATASAAWRQRRRISAWISSVASRKPRPLAGIPSSDSGLPKTTQHGRRFRVRPPEGLDPARDHGYALVERDHDRARLEFPRVAEPLPRPFREHRDDVAVADELSRPPKPFAVALAATDREPTRPGKRLADHRDLRQLRLHHVPDSAPRERADERRVDRREVVDGEHASP